MLKPFLLSFSREIESVDYKSFDIDPYSAKYLDWIISHKAYYLRIYLQVLEKAIRLSTKKREDIILLDYGAGNGMLGLFAKHCGFKKAYAVDSDERAVRSARLLNEKMRHPVDSILFGDIDRASDFFSENEPPDIIVGTDMIEHIYHPASFFEGIKKINPRMISVFTTGAVTANPFKSRRMREIQLQDEFEGGNAEHSHHNNPYAGLPFLETRRRIIRETGMVKEELVERFSEATRGMNKKDILLAVSEFNNTGRFPIIIDHPTNTCDPFSGSWTERLLTVDQYRKLYTDAGFDLTVFNGFYNQWQPGSKGALLKIINIAISVLGTGARWISPYIVLVGRQAK